LGEIVTSIIEESLKYYEAFINEPNNCYRLIEASLSECYHWLVQSLKESKNVTCSFRYLVNGYEISCLYDLVKASVEVSSNGVRIDFRGFVFVPEHASGSEMSFFNIAYELSDKGEELYFDNSLGDPCETSENEVINTFLDMSRHLYLRRKTE
jgi:hypothetical protein